VWKATLPYVPADLFVAIGPPLPERMDVAALSPLGSALSDDPAPP
jgi:hypothetical protein